MTLVPKQQFNFLPGGLGSMKRGGGGQVSVTNGVRPVPRALHRSKIKLTIQPLDLCSHPQFIVVS